MKKWLGQQHHIGHLRTQVAGNGFTITALKALCFSWEKLRENRILCILCDLRGADYQFVMMRPNGCGRV